jgi:hypothetical protein
LILLFRRKKGEDNEVVEDQKMKTMRRNLQTEDGSELDRWIDR